MSYEVLIEEDKVVYLPDELIEYFQAGSGDRIRFKCLEDGEVRIEKVKNFSSFLDEINRKMREGGYFEEAGLKNEEDVVDLIRSLRDNKN